MRGRLMRAFLVLAGVLAQPACGAEDETARTHNPGGDGGGAGAAGGSPSGGGSAGAAGSATGGLAGSAGNGGADSGTPDGNSSDGSQDASDDASSEGSTDAESDAPDAIVSQFCGDGVRDPVTEECDDGTGSIPADSCSANCHVLDFLVSPSASPDASSVLEARTLGLGRHPIAAGANGFAVAFVHRNAVPNALWLRAFDPKGTPGPLIQVAKDSTILDQSDPSVAALPGNQYAVAYTDLNGAGDGNSQGVAFRIVNASTGSVGPVVRVNSPVALNQHDADVIWTGSELVVTYTDETITSSKSELRLRRFDANGTAKAGVITVAGTPAGEGRAALAPFAGGEAISWIAASATTHVLFVQAGGGQWSLSLPATTDPESRPALVELDSTHLLLAYVEGGSSGYVARLRGALVDTSVAGPLAPFDIAPLVEPYASDTSLGQTQPALSRIGDRVFVAWRSSSIPLSEQATELWLKEIPWSATGGTLDLDLSLEELPLPRQSAHAKGKQDYPALAATPLGPGGALASAWEDGARVFGDAEGFPDVISELIPVPIVRLPSEGGLE